MIRALARNPAAWALVLACAALALPVFAHESRPARLALVQIDTTTPAMPGDAGSASTASAAVETWQVDWKMPARGEVALRLEPVLPAHCVPTDRRRESLATDAWHASWTVACAAPGLTGSTLAVDGLDTTITDVLVTVRFADGREPAALLRAGASRWTVPREPGPFEVLTQYTRHGVDHILGGWDHLLFVLALVLLIRGAWPLTRAITSFTLAHASTIVLATLGVIHVPGAPVEAAIALSIVLLAAEVVRHARDGRRPRMHRPATVAFAFGLIHGLGFAGALAELGMPHGQLPIALAAFNIGVEIGQLAFVLVVVGARHALLRAWRMARGAVPAPRAATAIGTASVIGCVGAYWLIDRVVGFV